MKKYKKICIGMDESYANFGLSICADGALVKVGSIKLSDCECKSEKRKMLADKLTLLFAKCKQQSEECIVVCERIRTFSGGVLSKQYIMATGALIATIVDNAYKYDIPVFSVDTRCWKSAIVGTSKPDKNGDKKMPAIKFMCRLGWRDSLLIPVTGRANKNVFVIDGKKFKWNDDAADSGCIALYGFVPESEQKLLQEN